MRRYVFSIIMTLFLFAWMQMIKPALTGNLGGTFSYHPIPSGFREFQSVLIKDAQFSRTLWIPRQSRFSYYDSNHPPVELSAISPATTSAELSAEINDPVFQKKLIVSGIGYLVVPADPLGELFREERKYSQDLRDGYVRVLDRVPWLTKIQNGDIEVYKTKSHNNLFALPDGTGINFLRKNDAEYEITVLSGAATKLLFAQSYNAGWVVRYNNQAIRSSRTSDGFIEFDIPFRDKTMKGTVVFEPDGYRVIGYIVSAISVLIVLCVVGIRFI
jgi:hypothetical protein